MQYFSMATVIQGKKTESLTVKHKTVQNEVVFAECECCSLTEECTPAYIGRIREKFSGRWLCGLCSEAVKEETVRSEADITTNEALDRHMKFCEQFKSSGPPINPAEDLIFAMKQLLRRTLDSPRKSGTPTSSFVRSEDCFSSLSNRVQSEV